MWYKVDMNAESFPEPNFTPEQELEIEKLVDKRGISYEMATIAVTGSIATVRSESTPPAQEAIVTPIKKKKRRSGNSQFRNLRAGNTRYDNDSYYTDYALPGQRKYVPAATIVHDQSLVTPAEADPLVTPEPEQVKDVPLTLDIFDIPEK